MEQLFYSIQQHIATNMSVLSTIDEDYTSSRQTKTPIRSPFLRTDKCGTNRLGKPLRAECSAVKCTVVITLGIDCYDDTRYGSGTEEKGC